MMSDEKISRLSKDQPTTQLRRDLLSSEFLHKLNFLANLSTTHLEFIVPDNGNVMAAHLSIEIAANVLTEAETETP